MNYEVFDKTTEDKYKRTAAKLRLDIDQHRIRINVSAIEDMGYNRTMKDQYIKFFRLGKVWYAAATTDATGYAVRPETRERGGANISAAVVMNEIVKLGKGVEFYLVKTENEMAGQPLFELLPKGK